MSVDAGRVTAESRETGGDDPRFSFTWQERNGPPIAGLPSRKGFGSRLIEQVLRYELGGEVEQAFASEGLCTRILLPIARLSANGERAAPPADQRPDRPRSSRGPLPGGRVLVVEDEYLVGQETADALAAAGCEVTGPVGTMGEALRIAVTDDLDAAAFDMNLHGKMVWPVARALKPRGTPFAFVTGYAETVQPPPDLNGAPRTEKPLYNNALLGAVDAAIHRKTGLFDS